MSEDQKTTIERNETAIWEEAKVDLMDGAYASNLVYHRPPFPDTVGLEAYKQHVANTLRAFSDIQFTFDEIVIEGDVTVTRWTWQGTHTGQGLLIPIPPTGNRVTFVGTTVAHLVDGKTVEAWQHADWLGFLQQLGVVPPMG